MFFVLASKLEIVIDILYRRSSQWPSTAPTIRRGWAWPVTLGAVRWSFAATAVKSIGPASIGTAINGPKIMPFGKYLHIHHKSMPYAIDYMPISIQQRNPTRLEHGRFAAGRTNLSRTESPRSRQLHQRCRLQPKRSAIANAVRLGIGLHKPIVLAAECRYSDLPSVSAEFRNECHAQEASLSRLWSRLLYGLYAAQASGSRSRLARSGSSVWQL